MKDFRRKTLALVLAGLTMLSSAAPTFADTMDESVQTSSESVIDSEDAVVASSVVDSSAADEADTAETDEQEDTAVTDQSETKETTEDAAVPTEEAAKGTEESSSENAHRRLLCRKMARRPSRTKTGIKLWLMSQTRIHTQPL